MITPVSIGIQIYMNVTIANKFSGDRPLQRRDFLSSLIFLSFAVGTYVILCQSFFASVVVFQRTR